MNVGQVEFSVSSKTLESVLASARELDSILNGIDGRSYGGGGSGARRSALDIRNRTRRMFANEEKRYVLKQRNARLKANKELYLAQAKMEHRHRQSLKKSEAALLKERQNAERKYAIQEHARRKKQIADEARAQANALNQVNVERAKFQKGIQQQFVNLGAQAQTLGASLQRMTSPFTNIYRGVLYGVGYRLLGKVTESISGAFSRYDTIKTYSKVLNNLGIDATKKFSIAGEEATDVYHNLENAVLGLPTGIDEIIESMRRYAGATGEAERATKLAIAANNAYIAGHMGEREKLFTERQLVALAGGAELSTNQWDSLRRNAPLAIKVVAKEMKMGVQEMIDALKEGTVSGQEFLDVFIKAGTEGKIRDAAQVMKETWDAVAQNIQNRLNAMGEGILNTLDEVFEKTDGRTFLEHVLGFDTKGRYIKGHGIRGVIDDMAKSAQDWIRSNPDKILKFLDNIKEIDWKGIVGGFADMGLKLGTFYSGMAKVFGNKFFIESMIGLNMAGKVIQTGGGLLKGTAWLSSWLITLAKFGKAGSVAKGVSNMTLIATKGKKLKTAAESTASMALSWQQVAVKGINVLAIGVVAASIKLIASAFVDIGKANVDPGKLTQFAIGAAAFIGEFAVLSQVLGAKGALTGIAQFSRVLGEAEIAVIAHDISAVAKALGDVDAVDIPKKSKLKRVMRAVSDFADVLPSTDVFTAIGKFFSSKAVSNTAKAVSSVTTAISSVNNIKGSLKKFRKAMFGDMNPYQGGKGGGSWGDDNSIVGIMQDMLAAFENDSILNTLSKKWKSSNVASVFNSIAGMMEDFTTIASTKIKAEQINKATENIQSLSNAIAPLLSAFEQLYSAQFGTTSAEGKTRAEVKGAKAANKSISSSYGAQAQGFAKMMEYLNTTLSFVAQIMTKFNRMRSRLEELKSNYGAEGELDFTEIGNVIGGITGMFDGLGVATGDYSLAPENMEYINEAMDSLGTVVQKLIGVKTQITDLTQGGEGGFFDIGAQIEQVITDINAACNGVPQLEAGASMLSSAIGVLKGAMTKLSTISGDYTAQVANIKSAIEQLSQIGSKVIFISLTIDGKIDNKIPAIILEAKLAIEKALKLINPTYEKVVDVSIKLGIHTDTVSPYISGVASRIWRAFNSIPTSLNKTVTMNIKKQRNEVVVSTGGRVGHKIQYRAHGGSIFQPKGTDTIPAMLTPGEYVMNHMASNAIGYDILQKLNHLDIAGAIQGLYAKASSSVVNNTKNANLTINNYNSPSVGFVKGNRWVQSI